MGEIFNSKWNNINRPRTIVLYWLNNWETYILGQLNVNLDLTVSKRQTLFCKLLFCSACVHMVNHFSSVWLCDPVDYSPPGSSVHEILRARILEWVVISFSRESSWPGIEPGSPTLQTDSLSSETPGNPKPAFNDVQRRF